MMKRPAIILMAAIVLVNLVGCEAKTRYRALCLLFDGVPPPPGMVPCEEDGLSPAPVASSRASGKTEVAREFTQHGPYAAKLCEGCHQRQTNKLLMAKEDLCFNCHDLAIKKRIVHGPVASGSCIICHNPHGSGNKYLLVAKSQEFCLHCHQREDILKSDAHQDMDEGCTNCHNAHASDNDYLLISKAADIYKAKRQTPPRASRPLKDQASGAKQGQPTTSSTKQVLPSTSSTKKQGLPSTSGLVPPRPGKLPSSSGTPPAQPGAGLKQKQISKNLQLPPEASGRVMELTEANR